MENLEIISTHTTVQGKKLINGNNVNFSWNTNGNDAIKAINFNLQRGTPNIPVPPINGTGEGLPLAPIMPSYTGNNVITGAYYPESGKFDVQNNNFQDGDFEIYSEILDTVKGIVEPIEIN